MKRFEAIRYRKTIEKAASLQNDEAALDNIFLFPKWEENIDVVAGDRYRHNGVLYRCVQSHHTQQDWQPNITSALWVIVSLDDYPQWVQPTGVQNAYMKGDKVSHNYKHWISLVDNNVWEPGSVGTDSLWQQEE